MRLLMLMLCLAASVAIAGCEQCSLVGCESLLRVRIRSTAQSMPNGTYALDVTVGERHEHFELTRTGTEAPHQTTADGQFDVALDDETLTLQIRGTPASAHVALAHDGRAVVEETLSPTYTEYSPDEDCGPVCQGATADLAMK